MEVKNNYHQTRTKIYDYEIIEVEETKFLGVAIDNKLNWMSELKFLAKKLRWCYITGVASGQLNIIQNSYLHTYTKT